MADRTTRQLQPQAADRLDAYRRRRGRRATNAPWERYAAAAGAAVAGASTAEAAIVHVVPENPIRISVAGSSFTTTTLDLDNDGSPDASFSLSRTTTSSFTTFFDSSTSYTTISARAFAGGLNGARVIRDAAGDARNFASGELISASLTNDGSFGLLRGGQQTITFIETSVGSTYVTSGSFSDGPFAPDEAGFVGLRFNSPRGVQNAWIRIRVDSAPQSIVPGAIEVLEWAYEDSGGPIAAGAVPEPTGLALLAAGAAGIAGLRRRSEPR